MSPKRMGLSLQALKKVLREHGVSRAYYKWLASNDNSKNQIYLGRDFRALNILPLGQISTTPSGKDRRLVFKAPVRWSWLSDDGELVEAPHTQVIYYHQYPEVRLSGFLEGSPSAPSDLLRGRQPGRVLVFGISDDGSVVGYAASADSAIVAELPTPDDGKRQIFIDLPISARLPTRELLLRELRRIHALGWINSKKLTSSGDLAPCESSQCGGYTLEAELGVRPNGFSLPDFEGWEVKQYGVSKPTKPTGVLTLMTPEPDGGLYKTKGVSLFVRRFGYEDKLGRHDRLNFGGVHRVGTRSPLTNLTLILSGFESKRRMITDANGEMRLVADSGEIAASWGFTKLMEHWKRKHAQAAFVPSLMRRTPRRQYRYGPTVHLGEGADFIQLLSALSSGAVYYDPALKIVGASTAHPETKRRNQFRIRSADLGSLYRRFLAEDVSPET